MNNFAQFSGQPSMSNFGQFGGMNSNGAPMNNEVILNKILFHFHYKFIFNINLYINFTTAGII